jgi:hypothetical protein
MRSKFVTCQAPKPAPRSRRKRREFLGGRVPRKMADQYYCSAACRQRAHYWGYPVYGEAEVEQS